MRVLFVPAKYKIELDKKVVEGISLNLPKNIAIAYSIQFEKLAIGLKKELSKEHKITSIFQTLGCKNISLPKSTDAVLLVGSGRFHAVSLVLESKLPVYLFNGSNLEQISDLELNSFARTKRASYLNYLNADSIGILVSTKPGQNKFKQAIDFSRKLQDKKSYLFISNNINTNEFQNFGLKSWVNTACPRMDFDNPYLINLGDLSNLKN